MRLQWKDFRFDGMDGFDTMFEWRELTGVNTVSYSHTVILFMNGRVQVAPVTGVPIEDWPDAPRNWEWM